MHKRNFKQYLILILVICCTLSIKTVTSQVLFAGVGPARSHTKQTVKLVNGKDDFFYSYTQKIIGLKIPVKNRIDVNLTLAHYRATTLMRINKSHREGFAGTNMYRVDIGLSYSLLKDRNRIFIKPSFAIGFQFARKLGDLWGEQVHIYGPDYYQTRIPYSEGHNNFQLVPVAGFSMGVKFFKRCEAGISMHGVWGYKTFQRLYFFYNHKDTPTIERLAIFESRGTGIYSAIFLGVNIGKKSKLNGSNNHAR